MRKGTVSQTVLYLACKNGGKTPEEVLENTWHSFSTGSGPANVCAWNLATGNHDRPLYYYFTTNGLGNTSCYQLLRDGDGQCHAWVELFEKTLLANGISSSIILLAADTNSFPFFLVRNVALKTYRPPSPTTGVYRYYESDFDQTVTGLPGQNMLTPKRKKFIQHFVVRPAISTVYYDPSYGVRTEAISAYTPIAIGAWSRYYEAQGVLWAPQEEDPQRTLEALDLGPTN